MVIVTMTFHIQNQPQNHQRRRQTVPLECIAGMHTHTTVRAWPITYQAIVCVTGLQQDKRLQRRTILLLKAGEIEILPDSACGYTGPQPCLPNEAVLAAREL